MGTRLADYYVAPGTYSVRAHIAWPNSNVDRFCRVIAWPDCGRAGSARDARLPQPVGDGHRLRPAVARPGGQPEPGHWHWSVC